MDLQLIAQMIRTSFQANELLGIIDAHRHDQTIKLRDIQTIFNRKYQSINPDYDVKDYHFFNVYQVMA